MACRQRNRNRVEPFEKRGCTGRAGGYRYISPHATRALLVGRQPGGHVPCTGVPERYVGVTEKPASDSKRSLMCAAVRGGKSQIGGFFVSSLFLFSFPFSVSSLFFTILCVQCSEGAAARVSARPRKDPRIQNLKQISSRAE